MRFFSKNRKTCSDLRPGTVEEYKRLHANVWPQVLEAIARANITNYSIFLKEPENLLFGYWEYAGDDFSADMAEMARSERMRQWWAICEPLQLPFPMRLPGEWWAQMSEVFHME
ncbi:L-rhamnose mutarotase [Rhizobium rhizogenes]|uniref:L-rhamnose mutarotase n=1 Tax=Rhizobium rhizogenes TaxID=359 RepID=UPI0038691E82